MSSIKYIIWQYTRVNSFIRSRGCAALDRINEFTREYCPITYTYWIKVKRHTTQVPNQLSASKRSMYVHHVIPILTSMSESTVKCTTFFQYLVKMNDTIKVLSDSVNALLYVSAICRWGLNTDKQKTNIYIGFRNRHANLESWSEIGIRLDFLSIKQ